MSDSTLSQLTQNSSLPILVAAIMLAFFIAVLIIVLLIVCIRYKKRSGAVEEATSTDESLKMDVSNNEAGKFYSIELAQEGGKQSQGSVERHMPLVTVSLHCLSHDIVLDMETNEHYHRLRMDEGGVDSPESATSLHLPSVDAPNKPIPSPNTRNDEVDGYDKEDDVIVEERKDVVNTYLKEKRRERQFLKPHLPVKEMSSLLNVHTQSNFTAEGTSFSRCLSETCIDFESGANFSPPYSRTSVSSTLSLNILEIEPANIVTDGTLGMGQFGQVHLGHTRGLNAIELGIGFDSDRTQSHDVAVKFLNQNATEKDLKSFQKEVKYMSRLRHKNVIQILAVCWQEEKFIVLEYMKNGDLQSFLQTYKAVNMGQETYGDTISYHKLVNMSLQIADAMKYLSSCKYIHRDLACRNCLVGENFLIKVADFGLSKNLYDSCYYRFRGSAILPIRWMAPECFYGRFSEKSDVWGFGVTLWEIFNLCRERPYTNLRDEQIVEGALNGTLKILEKPECCETEIYHIMKKCLRPRAADRPKFEELYAGFSTLGAPTQQC